VEAQQWDTGIRFDWTLFEGFERRNRLLPAQSSEKSRSATQTVPALEALEQRPLEADACVPLLRLHAVVRAAQNAVLGY